MNRPELSFQKIEIRRMPGFPSGGFEVGELCAGVNIIYGPNASGKTTLSRAIQKLLCPKDPPHQQRSIRAGLELHGDGYTIDCDLGRVRCQREGVDVDCPPLAPADIGDHYVLALHDLIRSEDDRDLATQIVRESAGGYDVGEAREKLGFRDRPSGRGNLGRDLDSAIGARREARNNQEKLADDEKTLADLRVKKHQARKAGIRLQSLQKALEHADARQQYEEARRELDAFPPGVGKLAGDETERLAALRGSLSKARDRRRGEQLKLELAKEELAGCKLPEEGVSAELLGTLRKKCQRLEVLSAEIRSSGQEFGEAGAALEVARQNLGPAINEKQLESVGLGMVEELSTFARRAERLRADTIAAEELRAWLGADDQPVPGDPHALNQGIWLLQRWIAVDDSLTSPPRRKLLSLIAAVAMLVLSLSMSVVHPSWLLLIPVAAGLLVWAFMPRGQFDAQAAICREFESLGIGSPPSWAPAEVRSFAVQLQRRCAEATLRQEKATRWSGLSHQLEALARRRERMHKEKAEWIERLGVVAENGEADEAWLYLLAANTNRLQQAQQRSATARAALDNTVNEHRALLNWISETIHPFGSQPVGDPESALSHVEQLSQRSQAHQAAAATVANSVRTLELIEEEITAAAADETALFERVGLSTEQEATLREWSRMHKQYLQADEKLRIARHVLESAEAALANQPELMGRSREELEEEQDRCRQLAEQAESINQEIGAIENAIATAKTSTDLEARLAQEEECADALRRRREQDYEAVVGNVLADFLLRQQRDRQQPGVLKRARELFADITQGQYRLDIDPGDPPGFRAFDTKRAVGLRLEELSSGTRLQLLLAVRVAFVERQEQGIKLPLILDETLGNSDERRAKQIIDAAIEICRDGRQVFYFTAQHDEVGKWNAILSRHQDVQHRLIDLAQLRGFDESDRVWPIDYQRPQPVEVPSPEGSDWLAYGRRLEVPVFEPRREIGAVHLWYLIDDLPTLCRLLRQGVDRWGQLQTLADYGHDDSLCVDSEVYRRADAAARLLESASRYWRIGRGAAVDRQVLLDSNAVSDNYIDRVSDLADSLCGDARALLAALEAGQVRGFRTEKRGELRDFLAVEGYLDQRDVLGTEQIRRQLRAVVFSDLEQGLLSPDRFEQLLAMALGEGADEAGARQV